MENLNFKDDLSSAIEIVSRLLDCKLPASLPAGFSLSLVYAYEELLSAQSYLNDTDL